MDNYYEKDTQMYIRKLKRSAEAARHEASLNTLNSLWRTFLDLSIADKFNYENVQKVVENLEEWHLSCIDSLYEEENEDE